MEIKMLGTDGLKKLWDKIQAAMESKGLGDVKEESITSAFESVYTKLEEE
jgi:hypothetical protein